MFVTRWQNAHLPPLTFCRRVTQKDDRVTTLYTPWTTPSDTVARNSFAHARGAVDRGVNFKHFKTSVGCTRYWTFRPRVTSSHTNLGQ